MTHIASIIHLPDLHLFIHGDGTARAPRDRRLVEYVAIAVLGRWLHGLATADGTAFEELREFLPILVETERAQGAAVVVAQTGDVEAFGHVPPDGLGGFTFLHDSLWPELERRGAQRCIDLYGNHDIWPGFPPLPWSEHDPRHLLARTAFQDDWRLPIDVPTGHGLTLRFHRVNTIDVGWFTGGVLARGSVGPHPPLPSASAQEIADQVREVARYNADPSLQVILCHHPPHLFSPTSGTAYTTGYLDGANELSTVTPTPVPLIIAGHRHLQDPTNAIDIQRGSQPPLHKGAGQLVGESPTQQDGNPNSFAVYRLQLDNDRSTIGVDRLTFSFRQSTGLQRTPREEREILSDLRTLPAGWPLEA